LYTIGYGGKKSFLDFLAVLNQNRVSLLLDVRINPHCGFNADFIGNNLSKLLAKNNINYEHFLELGNVWRSTEGEYDKDTRSELYNELLSNAGELLTRRLRDRGSHDVVVCIMCGCAKHDECHRNSIAIYMQKQYHWDIIHI